MLLQELVSHVPAKLPPVDVASAEPVTLPDLLHARPLVRIDPEQTKLAIGFAFASGVSGGVFAEALEKAKVAPSRWDPGSFASDLFLSQFVSLCLKVRVNGQDVVASTEYLTRLLAHPPADPAHVEHRRAILAELAASPPLRAQLEQLYVTLCRLRSVLEGATGAGKWDPNRRQIEILQLVKDVVDRAAEGFVGARSGLAQLAAFGRRVQEGEPYRSLADLLRYDERLATLSLRVRVGADGRIRCSYAPRSFREHLGPLPVGVGSCLCKSS